MTLLDEAKDKWTQYHIEEMGWKHLNNFPIFTKIFFEVRSKCNGRCEFCSASIKYDNREDITMDFNLYHLVIKQLHDIDYSGSLAFHVNNEPLLFKDLEMFCKHARKWVPKSYIRILTNGSLLTLNRAISLRDSGINEIYVNYYSFSRKPELLEVFQQIAEVANPIIFKVRLRKEDEILTSRAGTSPNRKAKDMSGFCEWPFTQFNINPMGIVSKCCADIFFDDPMGDVKKNKVIDIWNGKKFTDVREDLLKGIRKNNKQCTICDLGFTYKPYLKKAGYQGDKIELPNMKVTDET